MYTGATITVETTVRRWYEGQYGGEVNDVRVDGYDEREIQLTREIPDVETFVELLEAKRNDAIRYCWNQIKDEPEWEDWGWYGPYAKGDVSLSASRAGVSWDEVVDYIAERDDVDDKAGVYLQLRSHRRTPDTDTNDALLSRFLQYLADERGVDTWHYTHGRKAQSDD